MKLVVKHLILGQNLKSYQWTTYLASFDWTLWKAVILTLLISSFSLWFFEQPFSDLKRFQLIDFIGICGSSLFAMKLIDANDRNTRLSSKILLFNIFIGGSILFYGYQASLTSVLSVPIERLPFKTPEEMLNTNYK